MSNRSAPGKVSLRSGQDVEMGGPHVIAPHKRRRKRTYLRLPVSVALGTLTIFVFFVLLGKHHGANSADATSATKTPKRVDTGQPTLFTYEIIAEFPHDAKAYTQGLQYEEQCDNDGTNCREIFWESTGLNGRSQIREVDVKTGKVLRSRDLPREDFGEGVTRHGDKLYQLTWQSGKTWSYSVDNFDERKQLKTPLKDGWGITSNGTHLFVGDSTDQIHILDPTNLRSVGQIHVTDAMGSIPVKWLNELEWVDGTIFSNIYTTNCLAQLNPETGGIVGWVMLDGLREKALAAAAEQGISTTSHDAPEVLNGIAFDAKRARLFVTGKLWPRVYQIELRPMYLDSKATDVAGINTRIREECIISPDRTLG